MKLPIVTFLFLLLAANVSTLAGVPISCPVTADTWVAVPDFDTPKPTASPAYQNHGADPQLPIQGYLSFALFQFDVSALKGRSITKATMRVHRYNTPPVPLHTVGISTISGSGPWSEGTQKQGPAARGSVNFYYARNGDQSWSFPGSDLVDVTFGQGGSLYAYGQVRDAGNGWYEINVSPAIIGALLSGDQYGLILCDEKGQARTIHLLESRESQHPPLLVVEVGEEDKLAPGRVKPLQSDSGIGHSSPEEARVLGRTTLRRGGVILKIGGAGDNRGDGVASRYELRYSEKPVTAANFGSAKEVPRWCLDPLAPKLNPLATSNALHDQVTAVVEQLRPGAVYYFAARAIDKAGNAGPVSPLGRYRAYDRTFPPLPRVETPAQAPVRSEEDQGPVRVWAVPELMKIDPQTGALLEQDFADHRLRNSVWDGIGGVVHLTGARNEFVAFQLAIETAEPVSEAKVQVSKTLFPGTKLPEIFRETGAIQLAREWFVPGKAGVEGKQSWYPDALVPLAPTFAIPMKDNGVPGQRVQPIFVDVYIPHEAAPGMHIGKLKVGAGGFEREITLEVQVLPLTLPDKLNFVVDLNCYGAVPTPVGVERGTPEYRRILQAYHRVAHQHRTTLDILGYNQTGGVEPDNAPVLEGAGAATRAVDWGNWDVHFGPLLDGSAFADLPRASIPVANMYLPFFENWPGDLRRNYRFSHPLQINTAEEYRDLITRHALEAGPIEEAFSQEYQDRFSAVAGAFARHIQDRGWVSTRYFIYFNNKYYFKDPVRSSGKGSSLWLLDEPNHRDDARALSFFAALAKRGLKDYPQVPILVRTDISRVEWIRDLLAGQIDLNCVSQKLLDKNRYLLDDRYRFGREYWQYGSTNDPSTTNIPMRAWCWRAWVNGADGVVPWNTVAGMSSWDQAEPLTVFYPGMKFGQDEPFPSIRLKAYRRGQQDVEYLILLAHRQEWGREAVAQAIGKALNLSGRTLQTYEEDAGTLSFDQVRNDQMEELKLRVVKALMQ